MVEPGSIGGAGGLGGMQPAAATRAAQGAKHAFAGLPIQRGEPLSVLLADLSEEASFIHAETLEDKAKQEKTEDSVQDAWQRRRARLLQQVRSVWKGEEVGEEEKRKFSGDATELRRAIAGGTGGDSLDELLRQLGKGDASREVALLGEVLGDESLPAPERKTAETALNRLIATHGREAQAGAHSLPYAIEQAQKGSESLVALQRCYQSAIAGGLGLTLALSSTLETFGAANFNAGCDFLSRVASSEIANESRPLERAHLGDVLDRIKGLRVFRTAAARLHQALERAGGKPDKVLSDEKLTEHFFTVVGNPIEFDSRFNETLNALAPEPRLHFLQELRASVRELPDWAFPNVTERSRALQPIQEKIDYLVYEEGV